VPFHVESRIQVTVEVDGSSYGSDWMKIRAYQGACNRKLAAKAAFLADDSEANEIPHMGIISQGKSKWTI